MKFIADNLLIGGNAIIDWVIGILLKICMFIDALVYQLVAGVYEIFMALCRMNLSQFNTIFDSLIDRIYMLLGIIMLFVISFNLLQMLVDPNKATDSKLGGGSLVKHIFLSLIMLILAPFVFQLMGDAQEAILEERIIEKIVLGDSGTSLQDGGPVFSWTLFSAFFYPADNSEWSSSNSYLSGKVKNAYNSVYQGGVYDLTGLSSVADDSSVKYVPVISTIAGIVVIFQLLKFAISVGVRAFKLLFLELIAPIPIISYMDPGKGEGIFKKYVSEVISTFLDLFFKIGTLFLAILLANKAMDMIADETLFAFNLSWFGQIVAKVLIVVALFQFADKIPEIIGSIFGIKVQSSNTFGKMLGFAKGVGLGVAAGGVGAVAGGAIGGAGALAGSIARGDLRNADGKVSLGGAGKVAMNALGGTARGVGGGAKSMYSNGFNKKMFGTMGKAGIGAFQQQAVSSEQSRLAGGFFQKQFGRVDRALGGEYRANRKMETINKGIEGAQKDMQKASANRGAIQQMRGVAERQFAQEHNMSVDTARSTFGANFDNQVNDWIQNSGDSNAAFQASMTNYRNEYGVSDQTFNASTFVNAESAAETQFNAAAKASYDATQAKKSFEGTKTVLGTNEVRQKRMDATKKK